MKWNTVEIALVRLLFNWNFSPHYGQQVVPLSFGKRINDAWMKNFFYDYCYYSVGVVVAAKKSWFHLGLPQGSWLAYYCPPWLSTLSCFLPLLQGCWKVGGMAPPVLGRLLTHIPPRGQIMPTTIILAPPPSDF